MTNSVATSQNHFLEEITVLILTYNEEANIGRTLSRLDWARRIVVVDSGSTDKTVDIVRQFPCTEIVVRPFDNHPNQWNFGLEVCGNSSNWILALDADYIVGDAFRDELAGLNPTEEVSGYSASFRYCINGRPLRGSLYPPVTVLYRHSRARYFQDGHTQRLALSGLVLPMRAPLYHDDRKPLSRWFASQRKYAALEADHLLETPPRELSGVDRIRLMAWPAPILVFLYTLICKGCVLDGRAGWFYAAQRLVAELMLALEVHDRRSRRMQHQPASAGRRLTSP